MRFVQCCHDDAGGDLSGREKIEAKLGKRKASHREWLDFSSEKFYSPTETARRGENAPPWFSRRLILLLSRNAFDRSCAREHNKNSLDKPDEEGRERNCADGNSNLSEIGRHCFFIYFPSRRRRGKKENL